MLVKPTVAELLEKTENRYRLAIATAKRARQISQGSKPMVETDDISPVTIAADEIEEETLKIYNEEEWKEELNPNENSENINENEQKNNNSNE